MEVILRQAVEKLGHPGDIVKVSPGYARNFLLPRGYAYEATPGNKKRIEQERQRLEAAEEARRTSAQEYATRLEQVSLTFSARVLGVDPPGRRQLQACGSHTWLIRSSARGVDTGVRSVRTYGQ